MPQNARPNNKFLEFGGPCRAPNLSLYADSRKDFLNT